MIDASGAATAADEVARDCGLVRAVGLWGLTASIVNGVVGAGIFRLPAAMALAVGTQAPLAFLVCAAVMAAVVICFAEAGSRVPTSGGPYGYVEAAFGPLAGFVAGILLWLASALACGGIAAAIADAAAGLVPALSGGAARAAVILLTLGAIMAINIRGVGLAARLIAGATVIKLVPLATFLLVGGFALFSIAPPPTSGPAPQGDFGRALILALFAFCGMETPLAASGEVDRPARTIPYALMLAMGFIVLLYVAIQLVAEGLLGQGLAASGAPLADAIARVDPALGRLILIGTALSMLCWIGSDILGAPRVLFAFARDGLLPKALAAIHPRTRAPHVAIVVHTLIAAGLALSGTFVQLAILSTLATAGLYFLACGAAWALARRQTAVLGPPLAFRLLPLAAVAGMASMVLLVAMAEAAEIVGFVGVCAASVALYYVTRAARRSHG